MIKIQNISIQKGKKTIVKDVSFELCQGKITVAIGKNGAGKSTLLEGLTGSSLLQSGSILWDKKTLSSFDYQTLAQRRAVLSQSVNIAFPISVGELVEMGCYVSPKAMSNAMIQSHVQEALEEVQMLDFAGRDFNTLSGGERKRVLLAKCIVQLDCCYDANVPQYLFLDEPTASLDIQQQYKLMEGVKKLVKKRNIGVFAVLHDLNIAALFADEILMLRSGRLLKKGSPEEVFTPPILKRILDIETIVQPHPVFGCPHITVLPFPTQKKINKTQKIHF